LQSCFTPELIGAESYRPQTALHHLLSYGKNPSAPEGVTIANSTDTQRERQAYVFLGDNSQASGSALISERLTRGGETNNITRLINRGSFHYVEPATAEATAQICSGTFSTSRKLVIQPPPPPVP
jgi:hypothetical protein